MRGPRKDPRALPGRSGTVATAKGQDGGSISRSGTSIKRRPPENRPEIAAEPGYQLKPNIDIEKFVKDLRVSVYARTKSDSQPGLASLVEVEVVPGHILQFYLHIEAPAPRFKEVGVAPMRLGHVAVLNPEADRLRRFHEDVLGFWYTDEFEGIATFLTSTEITT